MIRLTRFKGDKGQIYRRGKMLEGHNKVLEKRVFKNQGGSQQRMGRI